MYTLLNLLKQLEYLGIKKTLATIFTYKIY